MIAKLKNVLDRAGKWPDWAQQDLAELAMEIDREISAGTYRVTREELRKIDEAIEAAQRGEIATDEEVEAVFAKHRGA